MGIATEIDKHERVIAFDSDVDPERVVYRPPKAYDDDTEPQLNNRFGTLSPSLRFSAYP